MRFSYLLLVIILLQSCKNSGVYLATVRANKVAIDSTQGSDLGIDTFVAPYKEKLDVEMQQALSYTPIDLHKKDSLKQTTLGNLTADICYDIANKKYQEQTGTSIDFALFNYGGLRAMLSKGTITKGSIFKLMPFENELVVVTLSGDKIEELVEFFIRSSRTHPISKQFALTITDASYRLSINGADFQKDKTYKVLTSDYLQNGGSNMNFFKDPKALYPLNYKVRTALIDYLKTIDTVRTAIDKRVIFKR